MKFFRYQYRSAYLLCFALCLPLFSFAQITYLEKAESPFWKKLLPFILEDSVPNLVSVDYQYHKGRCLLKNGEIKRGFFRFIQQDPKKYFYWVDYGKKYVEPESLHFATDTISPPEIIQFEDIVELSLSGKDSSIISSADSTVFIYVDKLKELLRVRIDSTIKIYDKSLIVDELQTSHLSFWKKRTVHSGSHSLSFNTGTTHTTFTRARPVWEWVDWPVYQRLRRGVKYYTSVEQMFSHLKRWKDIPAAVPVDPYIQRVADTLHKDNPEDIFFGISFSSGADKLSMVPFFTPMEIDLVDGEHLSGFGFIQPSSFKDLHVNSLVHFYDSMTFTYYSPEEIEKVTYKQKEYIPIWDNFNKQYYMAFPWVVGSIQYRIVEESNETDNFFNYSDNLKYRIYKHRRNDIWAWDPNAALLEAFEKSLSE